MSGKNRRLTSRKRIEALRQAIHKRKASHVNANAPKIFMDFKHREPNETKSDESTQYEIIRVFIGSLNIDPFDQKAVSEVFKRFGGEFDEDIIRQAVRDAQIKAIEDAQSKAVEDVQSKALQEIMYRAMYQS